MRVDARVDGALAGLAEVRAAVERDWRFAQREEAKARFEATLLERYPITIEEPEEQAAPPQAEGGR